MKKWTPLNYFIKLRKYKRINKNNALPSLSKFTLVLPAEIFRYTEFDIRHSKRFCQVNNWWLPPRAQQAHLYLKKFDLL